MKSQRNQVHPLFKPEEDRPQLKTHQKTESLRKRTQTQDQRNPRADDCMSFEDGNEKEIKEAREVFEARKKRE